MLLVELLLKPKKKKKKKTKILREVLRKHIPNLPASSRPQTRSWDSDDDKYKRSKELRQLGHGGVSSIAHEHKKSGDVVKYTDLGMRSQEHANYQFLRLALKHQDNPYFPKIYKAKTYPRRHAGDTSEIVMRMEKLYHLNDKNYRILLDELGIPFTGGSAWENSQTVDKLFQRAETRKRLLKSVKNPKLREAIRLLEPLFKHYVPDMHIHNWMLRANGELVIIDPVI